MIEVILPALDEAEAIPGVLAAIPPGFAALVVDNGSTDATAEVARARGARVVDEPRRGFGAACYAGLRAAESDVVCFMDCDGSLDPGQLHLVTDPVLAGRADLCLGARRVPPLVTPRHHQTWAAALTRLPQLRNSPTSA
jgi:glycosyltransferase involved in cell wall biosynthesis